HSLSLHDGSPDLGQGGDAESNIERWISQFRRADGSPASNAAKKRQITVGALPVALVEVQGTFVGGAGPMAVREERPNYMLLGAVAEGPDANWFFRVTRSSASARRLNDW